MKGVGHEFDWPLIGRHFWCKTLQGNESEILIGLFQEIFLVHHFEAVWWGQEGLH